MFDHECSLQADAAWESSHVMSQVTPSPFGALVLGIKPALSLPVPQIPMV